MVHAVLGVVAAHVAACVAGDAIRSMRGQRRTPQHERLLRVLSLPISPSACRRFRAVGVINHSLLCADMHTIVCFRKMANETIEA